MAWQARRNARSKRWRPRRYPAAGRLHLPFWAGWVAVIAGGAICYLALNQVLWPSTGQGATYQCRRNAYDCSDFRTRFEAQAAFMACGGPRNDVHRLDGDRDGWACEHLPLFAW